MFEVLNNIFIKLINFLNFKIILSQIIGITIIVVIDQSLTPYHKIYLITTIVISCMQIIMNQSIDIQKIIRR
jgi:hypothetical protein